MKPEPNDVLIGTLSGNRPTMFFEAYFQATWSFFLMVPCQAHALLGFVCPTIQMTVAFVSIIVLAKVLGCMWVHTPFSPPHTLSMVFCHYVIAPVRGRRGCAAEAMPGHLGVGGKRGYFLRVVSHLKQITIPFTQVGKLTRWFGFLLCLLFRY